MAVKKSNTKAATTPTAAKKIQQAKVTKPTAAKKASTASKAKKEEPVVEEEEEEQTKEELQIDDSESSSEDEAFAGFSEDEEAEEEQTKETETITATKQKDSTTAHEFKTLITKDTKKSNKKEDKKIKKGLVYLSRLPRGFESSEITKYFSQFGDITNIHVPRSKRTGNFKHFAFLEFSNVDDAKIAVETMNNYLVLGHILKAKLIENDEFKAPKHTKKYYNSEDKYKLKKDVGELNANVKSKREQRREALKAKGIDF